MWEQSHLPAVGPTSPGESLNVSDKIGGLINELEKAHVYIERLNEMVKAQQAAIALERRELARLESELTVQAQRNDRLEAPLGQVEALLSTPSH
jgi:hypothetical protein